jgi:hypothetical protein
MRVALIGPELEENLGLRYMAASLEQAGHAATIIPFNEEADTASVIGQVGSWAPQILGLSMVFTSRAREFCRLARALREAGRNGGRGDFGTMAAPVRHRARGRAGGRDNLAGQSAAGTEMKDHGR